MKANGAPMQSMTIDGVSYTLGDLIEYQSEQMQDPVRGRLTAVRDLTFETDNVAYPVGVWKDFVRKVGGDGHPKAQTLPAVRLPEFPAEAVFNIAVPATVGEFDVLMHAVDVFGARFELQRCLYVAAAKHALFSGETMRLINHLVAAGTCRRSAFMWLAIGEFFLEKLDIPGRCTRVHLQAEGPRYSVSKDTMAFLLDQPLHHLDEIRKVPLDKLSDFISRHGDQLKFRDNVRTCVHEYRLKVDPDYRAEHEAAETGTQPGGKPPADQRPRGPIGAVAILARIAADQNAQKNAAVGIEPASAIQAGVVALNFALIAWESGTRPSQEDLYLLTHLHAQLATELAKYQGTPT